MQLNPEEIFIPCAEEIGKRRDYRLVQQMLQLVREHGYTQSLLPDNIIEACIRESGSDVEQVTSETVVPRYMAIFVHLSRAVNKMRSSK